MGFDLYGKNKEDDKGKYFRNNIWWWHPLWLFVCNHCSEILTPDDEESGHFNGGHFITNKKAVKIAEKLETVIQTEEFKRECQSIIEYNLNSCRDDLIPFSEENVIDFITFCKNSGGFKIC